MSCKCQCCWNDYKVDVIVPDELWREIKPKQKPEMGGLLCGKCIITKIESTDEYMAYELVEIK